MWVCAVRSISVGENVQVGWQVSEQDKGGPCTQESVGRAQAPASTHMGKLYFFSAE